MTINSFTLSVLMLAATGGNISLAMNSNSKANSRRRTVVVIEKKLESEEGINGVTDDWVANGNDLIHTIRGESVLERPKDMSHYKKGSVTSATISPRRKKPVPKPEKPKWQTILSILTKNCLLLAAALWLGQMIWKWAEKVQYPTNNTYLTLDYEGRVSGVETSLKSMAKMFQVQSEVLDKKIGSEVGTVRREVMKQIEEKGALLGKELKSLDAKADSLEKSLSELKDMGFISKEEFEKFWNDLKNSGRLDGSVQDVNLDKIRAFARNIVEKEIEKHASDGLGRVDYALTSGGAKVTEHSQPYTFGKPDSWSAALKRRRRVHVNAHKMLEPSFGEPGHCFALEGSSGYIQIRLRTAIIPEAVTLEHVSKVMSCFTLYIAFTIIGHLKLSKHFLFLSFFCGSVYQFTGHSLVAMQRSGVKIISNLVIYII